MGTLHRIGVTAGLGLALAACQGDGVGTGPTEDDPQVTADVAMVVGEATANDYDMMTEEASKATRHGFGLGLGCGRLGLGWHCGARGFHFGFGHGNLMIEQDVIFRDANNVEQDDFDEETTASVQFIFSIVGEWTHGPVTTSIDNQRDFTVSGLAEEETQRIWNGSASSNKNRTRIVDDAGERTYDVSMSTVVEDVVIPVPRSWPLSGTITREVTVTKSDGTTRERMVTITFNGTSLVPIVINGTEFTFDLERRRIVEES